MELSRIVAEIDAEIHRLQQARAILGSATAAAAPSAPAVRRGRKPGPAKSTAAAPKQKRKRNLSPEGRARIQEALRKRWEEHRKNKPEGEQS